MTSRINALRSAVVDKIKAILPAANVERQFGRFNLDELEHVSIRCPAVRVAVLTAKVSPSPSGESEAPLQCAAFVVTDGRDRDEAAWTIGEAIAVQLHAGQMWGMTRLGGPTGVSITPVISAEIKRRGISIIAVEWRQELRRLGEGIFGADGCVIEELYINGEPVELPEDGGDDGQP